MQSMIVCVCARTAETVSMWGAEGGKCVGVNGNHKSQRSSDAQQESLSVVYTCCYTHTHELQLAGSASKISQAVVVVVVLKHHSTCINSHKYSCPWTWTFFFFLLYSRCASVQEWGSRGSVKDWKRKGKGRMVLKKEKYRQIREW